LQAVGIVRACPRKNFGKVLGQSLQLRRTALATTLLFPGMNRQKGTPEGRLPTREKLRTAKQSG
jgi:hypothetical protein